MGNQSQLKSFQDLTVWRESRRLFQIVFNLTKKFPKEEVFSSVSQMRRSSMSISSNIAKGFGRSTITDKLHFCIMARGSITELQNQIILTSDVKLMNDSARKLALDHAEITHKLIVGLIKATERRS